jgi:hypothetical protein
VDDSTLFMANKPQRLISIRHLLDKDVFFGGILVPGLTAGINYAWIVPDLNSWVFL